MAATLTSSTRRRLARAIAGCTLAGIGSVAASEVLIDPTRSPLGNPGAGTAAAPAPAARLQMILRGPGEQRTALIDGRTVRVGDSVRLPAGPARVERITDTAVVLLRGRARETLQLLPGLARAVTCTKRETVSQRPEGC